MELMIEEITNPANPNDFVGRKNLINAYNDVFNEFRSSKHGVRWVHISGEAGTGKSSLYRKLRMETESGRVGTGDVEVPISPKNAKHFLSDIKQMIDEMAPEWRSFLRRKTNMEIIKVMEPPESNKETVTEEHLKQIEETFFKDLIDINKKLVEKKQKNIIFLDDLDRVLSYGYVSILNMIPRIAKRFMDENFNLFIVTSSHYRADRNLRIKEAKEEGYVLHLELNQFDFKEAELMIRRRGKLVKSQRDLVVQSSTRFPFDLVLRQLMVSNEIDPVNLNAQTITHIFGFTEDEIKLLRELAKSDINYFSYEEMSRLYGEDVIQDLKNASFLQLSQDGYFIVESSAMWDLISHVFKPIDPRTEVILILNRIKDQAELGQLPVNKDIEIIKNHFTDIADKSLIFELASQIAEAATAALEGKLVQTAWNLLALSTHGLEKTEDYEKIADLNETIAKSFDKTDHDFFAAKAYQQAGKYYDMANIEWRAVANYREAGIKFKKEAEKIDIKIYHYVIRSILVNAIDSFTKANEISKAKRVVEDAKEILKDYENHVNYFNNFHIAGV